MKIQVYLIILAAGLSYWSCGSLKNTGSVGKLEIVQSEGQKRVDIRVNNKVLTSYQWPESVYKPILFPIRTLDGKEVTRGYPLAPREGERPDHRHHVGMWLNYGDINGIDFWGNGAEGLTRTNLGEIIHRGVENISTHNNSGILEVAADWIGPEKEEILSEKTRFRFGVIDQNTFLIDRTTTLTAVNGEVRFNDTKEGSFAIRLNRQLELPSEDGVTVLKKEGDSWTKMKTTSNREVTGNYLNSEGVTGYDVWGKRARWVALTGEIDEENVSVVIFDHPDNVNYPTYWHARGYGLFSANPYGVEDFTDGKEVLNFSIKQGDSFTMRYRTVICSGESLTETEIDALADEFARSDHSL